MQIQIVSAVECPRVQRVILLEKCEECIFNSGHLLGYDLTFCAWAPTEIERIERDDKLLPITD